MEIRVHPRVKKYLDKSGEKEKLKEHLRRLTEDPYNSRSGVDIKKLRGKNHARNMSTLTILERCNLDVSSI